jgi:hypothetical protein
VTGSRETRWAGGYIVAELHAVGVVSEGELVEDVLGEEGGHVGVADHRLLDEFGLEGGVVVDVVGLLVDVPPVRLDQVVDDLLPLSLGWVPEVLGDLPVLLESLGEEADLVAR